LEHTGLTVDPHQLLGIELNPRAAVVATSFFGSATYSGISALARRTAANTRHSHFHNIVEADALLAWKKKLAVKDNEGEAVTQWDNITKKEHPTTGQQVPDETARRSVYEYTDVKQAKWPEADFIVGNPPYIAARIFARSLATAMSQLFARLR